MSVRGFPEAQMRPGWRSVVPAIAFALVVAIPILPLSSGAGPSDGVGVAGATPFVLPAASVIPAVLEQPWATRAGFDPTVAADAADRSVVRGNLTVALTFWPASTEIFQTPTPGAIPLTPSQIADRYGLTPSQYSAVEQYFVGHGVSILHEWPDRLALTVRGPADAVDAAFDTQVVQAPLGHRVVEFPSSAPSLPAPFAGEVAAVSGLSTAESAFELPFASESAPAVSPSQGRTTSVINPNALHSVYGLDQLYNYSGTAHYAAGVGIALILWGAGYDPSDIQTYFSSIYPSDFPSEYANVHPYPIDNAPAPSASAITDPSNSTQELTLDIEWSGTAAPGATLDAVYAPDGAASNGYSPSDASMEDAINDAATKIPGVDVISMSFGSLDGQDPSFQAALSVSFAKATTEGITLLGASGDGGGDADTSGSCTGGPAPQFPSSSPDVIAVGGTAPVLSLGPLGSVTGLDSEPAWSLSGGGFSTVYNAPSWQEVGSAAAPIRADGHRGIPDVAGPANENIYYYDGGIAYGSGTSFATPMWAGLVGEMDALRGAPLGFITPRIYQLGAEEPTGTTTDGLSGITSGSTCIASAAAGWDEATGWGSPRALQLFEHLAGTFVNVTLSASPSPVAPGGLLRIGVQVLNQSSHRPIGMLPVGFTVAGSYSGPCSSVDSANGTTGQAGSTNVSVSIPDCYFGTSVTITVDVESDGYYGSNSTTVPVNLLGLAGIFALAQTYPYNLVAFALIMAAATAVGLYLGRRRHHGRGAAPPGTGSATPPATDASAPASGSDAPMPSPPPTPAPSYLPPPPPAAERPEPYEPVPPPPSGPTTPGGGAGPGVDGPAPVGPNGGVP
jgi:kumamolisin